MDNLQLLARIKNIPLVTSRLVEGLISGNYRSVFKGPGMEFDEVREYVEGDDARIIDWNVSSRMGGPYIKTFREERELVLFLLIDVSASLNIGGGDLNKSDTASVIAALLAFAAVRNNDQVGAVFFSDEIVKWVPPAKGQKHVNRLIQDMATIKPEGKGSELGLAVRTVQDSLKRRGICVILSDFRTSTGWRDLRILAKKHDVIAVKISDPLDHEFPPTGLMELRDPETGGGIVSSGKSTVFTRKYHEFWDIQHTYWLRECRRLGIATLTIDTAEDPVTQLIGYFTRRKGR
jgi:uncharacterized protein (DUF58 family)